MSEDLNLVHDKPYTVQPDSDGRPDCELADIWWANHLKRDRSVIQALFSGQFKSVMSCSTSGCNYTSARFEPFNFLSVPVPEEDERLIVVTVVPLKMKFTVHVTVRVSKKGVLQDVVDKVLELNLPGLKDGNFGKNKKVISAKNSSDRNKDTDASNSSLNNNININSEVTSKQEHLQSNDGAVNNSVKNSNIATAGSQENNNENTSTTATTTNTDKPKSILKPSSSTRNNTNTYTAAATSDADAIYFQAGELVNNRLRTFFTLDRKLESVRESEFLVLYQVRRPVGNIPISLLSAVDEIAGDEEGMHAQFQESESSSECANPSKEGANAAPAANAVFDPEKLFSSFYNGSYQWVSCLL